MKSLGYRSVLFVLVTGLVVAIISLSYMVIERFIGDDLNGQKVEERVVKSDAEFEKDVVWQDDSQRQSKVLGVDTHGSPIEEVYDVKSQQASAVFDLVEAAIEGRQPQKLHSLLSVDMATMFDLSAVQKGMMEAHPIQLERQGRLRIEGDWAYQGYRAVADDQGYLEYMVVLKHEESSWKLYGTVEP